MSAQWYLSSEGQTLGPYTGEQLQQFAQEGRIIDSTLLWAEGMTEWMPASQIPGVLPQPTAVAPAPAAAPAWAPPGARAAGSSALAPSTSLRPGPMAGAAPTDAPYPHIPVKSVSFGLWAGSFVGSIVLFIIALIATVALAQNDPENAATAGGFGGILLLLSVVAHVASAIFYCIIIYRAWLCLKAGAPRTTPGSAVGLMFVPLYNIYWMFVAINGLPKDWNRVVSSYEDLHNAPRLSETTFLLFCIGSIVFPPLSMIVVFPMLSQLCRGINFFAYRKNLTTSTGSPSGFGGIKFG
ncbi:MAG: DUF4339 domain-containing protein [Verrucomicrobia bacterium]|nr:MAG: DUF4339 domain-containing protein [Verrucomicrobiota bacterium]